jgi:hypothetical protein
MLTAIFAVAATAPVHVTLSEPLIVTALVAIGAAVVGAVVGGIVTYRVSLAAEEKRREELAKIRRSRKTYRPLRDELTALRNAMDAQAHLGFGRITRSDPGPLFRSQANLWQWSEIVDDGRAAIAVSNSMRKVLDGVNEAADEFNLTVERAQVGVKQRAETLVSEMNIPVQMLHWEVQDFVPLVRMHLDGQLHIVDQLGSNTLSPQHGALVAAWRADPIAQEWHERVTRVDAELSRHVDEAIDALDAAMVEIARKYERETSED